VLEAVAQELGMELRCHGLRDLLSVITNYLKIPLSDDIKSPLKKAF